MPTYITQGYSWATGDIITAARLNLNETNVITGLNAGTKSVNIAEILVNGTSILDSSRNVTNLISLVCDNITLDGDIVKIYAATNDANPQVRVGAVDAEELHIQSVYDTGAQTLDYVLFDTDVASATADKGKYVFSVDNTTIVSIVDAGVNLATGKALQINGTSVLSGTTLGSTIVTSSLTSVGTLTSLSTTGNISTLVAGSSTITSESSVNGSGVFLKCVGKNSTGTARTARMGLNQFADDVFSIDNGTTEYFRLNLTNGNLTLSGSEVIATLGAATTGTDLVITGSNEIRPKTSSLRTKKNIRPLDFNTENIFKLEPKSFEYKDSGDTSFGFIAEQAADVLPHIVYFQKDRKLETVVRTVVNEDGSKSAVEEKLEVEVGEPLPWSISYGQLVVPLIVELGKLREIVVSLAQRITVLEAK